MRNPYDFHESWNPIINLLYQEPLSTLFEEVLSNISYQPHWSKVFRVFKMPLKDIKVVILGTEPSFIPLISTGLAYAIPEHKPLNERLFVIQEELIRESFLERDKVEDTWKTLLHWEKQGVFLLNSTLTTRTGEIGSHEGAWEQFTKVVITFIATNNPCVWLFWGKYLQEFSKKIQLNAILVNDYDVNTIDQIPSDRDKNYIFITSYPELKRGEDLESHFYGCNNFIFANKILMKTKSTSIAW